MWGKLGCMGDRIIYARSSDGTISAFSRDGALVWEAEVPAFVPIIHQAAGERGVFHGPPEGATEVDQFHGIARFGQTIAVQVLRKHLKREAPGPDAPLPPPPDPGADLDVPDVSIRTVFVDLPSGEILGKDDSLPWIVAATEGRVAIASETPIPTIRVYSIAHP
jgi:hypothetical protein